VENDRRATRKVKLDCDNADNRTMLRISDAYRIEILSRILSELRSERSYVVRGARVEAPAGGFLCLKEKFCFGRALHTEDVRIILRSISACASESRRR
jgi:hypothetical protein